MKKSARAFVRIRGGKWHETFSVVGAEEVVETLCGVKAARIVSEFQGDAPWRTSSCKRCATEGEKEE